jgi:glycosyltransferase involved in cell wall biosynthesis
MKVLQLISIHQWTGPAEYVVKISKYLKTNHESVIVGFRSFYKGEFKNRLIKEDVDFTEKLKFPRGFKIKYLIEDFRRLSKLIDDYSPDIVHCHNSIENILTALIKKRNKNFLLVRSIHNSKYLKKKPFAEALFKSNDFIITNCNYFKENLIHRFDLNNNNVEVIRGFVDLEKFNSGRSKHFLKEQYGLNNTVNIGMVARFQPHRGHKFLIDAFCKLLKEYDNIRLILTGRGEILPELKKYVNILNISDKVIFTGYINKKLPELLNSLDIFVLLQEGSDGTCRAVLEAMATGLPIVTVKKGALKETIVDNKNGFFIDDKNNIEMLSEKLKILINNRELRYNTGQYSRQLVEENFSENIQLEKYYRFYKKILNERNN